jgi:hypothetical protein
MVNSAPDILQYFRKREHCLEGLLVSLLKRMREQSDDALYRARLTYCLEKCEERAKIIKEAKSIPMKERVPVEVRYLKSLEETSSRRSRSEDVAHLELVYHQLLTTYRTLSAFYYCLEDKRAAADLHLCEKLVKDELRKIADFEESIIHVL